MADSKADQAYAALLHKAKKALPEPTSSGERWEVPKVDVFVEGRATVVRNFGEIVEKMRREEAHLTTYLLREIGTAGDTEGGRLIIQGNVPPKTVQEKLADYAKSYVICSECGRPDTKLEKDERTTILRCEACGAKKPVVARRAKAPPKPEGLTEGKVYDLVIQDVSQRGDGVAKHLGHTIFVPGGKKGGQHKILIEKISGNVAFGKIQP